MKPETRVFLAKAHEDLRAAFHAAEALISERTGKIPKTHAGVHSEFARLIKDGTASDRPLSSFLIQAYKHKQMCDYGPTVSEEQSLEASIAALPAAVEFVARVEVLIANA